MADVGIRLTATDNTRAAFDSVGRSLSNVQSSAASVAGALAGIGIGISVGGFVAMTKSIVDGLDALNDLRDATGASIENISALEDVARRTGAGLDVVSTSLVKLNQGLNSAKPGSDTEAAIKAIGLSVKDLKQLDPAEAFRRVAVGLSGFADDANKARLVQELFGKSLKEVAPFLNDLAASGQLNATVTAKQAEEAEKFNKELFNLSKNATDLGRAIVKDMLPSLNAMAVEMAALKKTSAGFWDGFFTQATQNPFKTAGENAAKYRKEIESLEEYRQRLEKSGRGAGPDAVSLDKSIEIMKRRQAYFREVELQTTRFDDADNNDSVSRRFTRDKPTIGDLPNQNAAKEAAAAAAKALAEQNRELEKERALLSTLSGFNADYEEQLARLGRIREKGNISLTEYVQLVAELNAKQPAVKAGMDAEAKATQAIEKANQAAFEAREKYVASLGTGLETLQQETQSQQDYIDRLGLSKEAIAALDAAKLESQAVILDLIAIKELDKNLDEEQFELYKKQSAELRKQAALKMQGSIKEAQLEIEKEIAAERQRGWQETDRIARDVFTSWATEGGNAAQKIGDTLKKALLSAVYEATIKPLVFQIYGSITGSGGAGGAGAAGGFGGVAGLGSKVWDWITGGSGPAAAGGNMDKSVLFGTGYGTTGTEAAGGMFGGLGGLGSLFKQALPWIGGLSLLKSLTDYKVESRGSGITATVGGASGLPSGSVGMYNEFQQTGGLGGGGTTINRDWSVADQGVANYISTNVKNITASNKAYAEALGLTSGTIDSFTKSIEINTTGMDAAAQKAAIDAELAKFSAEQITASYGAALASISRDGETTTQTLQRLGDDLVGVNSMFADLGYTLYDVSVAGASAASTLVSAFGGLAAAQSQLGSFYQNFYSQDEQQANVYRNVQAELDKAGLSFTLDELRAATRGDIRAAVDRLAADKDTEQGAARYAAAVRAANTLSGFKPVANTVSEAAGAQPARPEPANFGGGANDVVSGGAEAFAEVVDEWGTVANAIKQAIDDLRKTLVETGPDGFARLQAQFAIDVAKATAGDIKAAESLPELAKSLIAAGKDNSVSSVGQALLIARTLASLESVSDAAAAASAASAAAVAAAAANASGASAPSFSGIGFNPLSLSYQDQAVIAFKEWNNSGNANLAPDPAMLAQYEEYLRQQTSGMVGYVRNPFERVPSFAIGTNIVPRDMMAMIHAGEEITPRPYVDLQRAARDDTNSLLGRLVAANAEMAARLEAIEANTRAGAQHGGAVSRLLTRVTPDGDAIATREVTA